MEDTAGNLICNAIMMTVPHSRFFALWMSNYEEQFNPDGWGEASIHLPGKLAQRNKGLLVLKDQQTFFYPSWNETSKIFKEDYRIPDTLVTLHLWETHSVSFMKIMSMKWVADNPSTMYSRIVCLLMRQNNSLLDPLRAQSEATV